MDELKEYTEKLGTRHKLMMAETAIAGHCLANEDVPAEDKKAFLKALAQRGETADQVAALALVFRGLARKPDLGPKVAQAIDIVGTGGDGQGSFNLSTAASILTAAAGVPVVKHGNRAVTSKSGSADFLQEMGIKIEADDATLARSLEELNFCFLFAPNFHPAFKSVVPVRKELAAEGQRTVFNLLGPLLNPASPPYLLMGVYAAEWVNPIAEALHLLELPRALVAHGILDKEAKTGLDELTCATENLVHGAGDLIQEDHVWIAKDFGFEPCSLEDLKGGSAKENFDLFIQLAEGKGSGGLHDSLLLNTGTALWLAKAVESVAQGIERARFVLLEGELMDWLERAEAFNAG